MSKGETLTYRGENIENLTKEQLLECVKEAYGEIKMYRKLYSDSQNSIIQGMRDMIKLKVSA